MIETRMIRRMDTSSVGCSNWKSKKEVVVSMKRKNNRLYNRIEEKEEEGVRTATDRK
jgi:hypothetical protein